MSTVRLLVTTPVAVEPVDGPTRSTSTSLKTVSTTGLPGLWPNDEVLMVASMVILSPTCT